MASIDTIQAFLAEPRNVVVSGIRRDGRPHLSPNWFYWDGQGFYVSTTRDRVGYSDGVTHALGYGYDPGQADRGCGPHRLAV